LLLLVDGNQTFFKPDVIRQGAVVAQRVAHSLAAEVLQAAGSKHKNDLASDVQVLISFFVDLDRLATDLASSSFVIERNQLFDFVRVLNAIPLFSVVDCAGGKAAVDTKLKGMDIAYLDIFGIC
jgi:hypothetical protein